MPEASNDVDWPGPAGFAVSFAAGAWSGVTAMPRAAAPVAIAAPAALVAVVIGVTPPPPLAT